MGFWSGLLKGLGAAGAAAAVPFTGGASLATLPAILGMAGAGLAAATSGAAKNRGEKFGGQVDLERLLMERDQQYQTQQIQREQEGRAGQSNAWRALLAAQHTMAPGARPQLSPYSLAPRQATGPELSGADALTQQMLARLRGGNPITPVTQRPVGVDAKLLNPGKLERLGGIAGPAASILSFLAKARGGNSPGGFAG